MSETRTRCMVGTAVMAAVSIVLSYMEFPMLFAPAFAKMDFSDLPALITGFAYGPVYGVAVELIKNLLGLLKTQTGGIGELANFAMGASYVLPAAVIYQLNRTRKGAVIAMIVGSFVMGVVAAVLNYAVLLPLYTMFMPMDQIIAMFTEILPFVHNSFDACLYSALPTNILKGFAISVLVFLLYKHISPILKGSK